jgi:hypothetical protein
MTKLHLGVVDLPYTESGQTTGEVAEILEGKYKVMESYFEAHKSQITKSMENAVQGAIENLLLGAPISSPYSAAESFIDKDFRKFLSMSEIENIGIPGVPTQAALDGVSHRFKNPKYTYVGKGKNRTKVKRPRRPSFIDTGLYQSSMKSWFE